MPLAVCMHTKCCVLVYTRQQPFMIVTASVSCPMDQQSSVFASSTSAKDGGFQGSGVPMLEAPCTEG